MVQWFYVVMAYRVLQGYNFLIVRLCIISVAKLYAVVNIKVVLRGWYEIILRGCDDNFLWFIFYAVSMK